VHYVQLPSLRVTADRPIMVNVDGEQTEATTLNYNVRRADLQVFMPRP
jgi:diacylglycerol kinase family enzyme